MSHTFLLQEVRELRGRGFEIATASVNAPNLPNGVMPTELEAEYAGTLYLKGKGAMSLLRRGLAVASLHPAVAWRGLLAAMRFGGWDLRRLAYALAYLAEAMVLGAAMRHSGSRHLHVHFGGPVASVGFLTAAAWDVSWSLTVHGPDEFFETANGRLREKLQSAAFIVAISEYTRSQVLMLLPLSQAEKVEVVRLGVNLEQLASLSSPTLAVVPKFVRKSLSKFDLEEIPKIVCVGRLVAAKAQSVLINAFSQLCRQGIAAELHLVGDGPERSSLESQTLRLDLGGRVIFHGSMAHTQALERVASASVFVLASFAEGLPVSLMEAMALGVPVVSTYIAGIPELIENGVSGTLVPAGDATALAFALREVLTDPERARLRALRGAEIVAADYDLGRSVDRLAELFQRRLQR